VEDSGLRIFLVDDHSVFREALRALLAQRDPSLEVVGESATAREGIRAVTELRPDLVVMDIVLGGTSGIAAVRELRRLDAACRVLILTAVAEAAFVVDALSAGADGYALKEQTADELLVAIQRVARGMGYIAPRMEQTLGGAGSGGVPLAGLEGTVASLSVREREVFQLVVAGYTNQRISNELFISVKTVETHRTRINKKLRVHSTVELLRLAALNGLVSA
jgi:DNA-binding NarL/FixJ family response regulator